MTPFIVDTLENSSLIYCKQIGFRKNHSTVDAIAELTENRKTRGRTVNKELSTVFLDLKKAFHTIDPEILARKLSMFKVAAEVFCWEDTACSHR